MASGRRTRSEIALLADDQIRAMIRTSWSRRTPRALTPDHPDAARRACPDSFFQARRRRTALRRLSSIVQRRWTLRGAERPGYRLFDYAGIHGRSACSC
jgi:hypothetical protein